MRMASLRRFGVFCVAVAALGPTNALAEFDVPTSVQTQEAIPGIELTGENYTLAPTAQNNGAVNRYTLTVEGTPYQVEGTDLLLYRLQELRALTIMEQQSEAGAFGEAAKSGIKAPVEGAIGLVTEPVDTVGNFVSGVGDFFSNLGHAAVGTSNEEEAGVFSTITGKDTARRQWAKEFKIDPYTNFPPVKDKLSSLSWSSAGGSLAVTGGMSQIPGTAGLVVSGTKAVQGFGQLVYDKGPAELKETNETRLESMKIPDEVIRAFLNHPSFTPTHTTEIITALYQISASNREAFLTRALAVDTSEAAFFMMRWAQMYLDYHVKVQPIQRFVNLGSAPVAQRSDGVLVVVVPTDHVAWTEGFASKHFKNMASIRNISGVTGGEIWLAGSISPLAQQKLEGEKWVVLANKGRELGLR